MTDVDTVAQAIWRADLSMFATLFKGKTWETLDEQWHNLYRDMAQAAIDAMVIDLDKAAEAAFLASLPVGPKGELIPGHSTWANLGPKGKERQRRIAQAVIDGLDRGPVD